MTLIPTCKLSLEVTRVLTDIELAGLKVNRDTLQKIKDDYTKEYNQLENDLLLIGKEVMGDTPFNLNSADDRSAIVYSRKVKDKKMWKGYFNLGSEM